MSGNFIYTRYKQYSISGVIIKLFLKLLSKVGIQIDVFYSLVYEISSFDINSVLSQNQIELFRKLSLDDFIKYGDKNWFSDKKINTIFSLLDNENIVYGIIKDNLIISSGWISLFKYAGFNENFMPSLKPCDAYLWDAYTHPIYRGNHLHKYLIFYRLYRLKELGKKKAYTFVSIYNKASYKGFSRCGFKKDQLFINYRIGNNSYHTTFKY